MNLTKLHKELDEIKQETYNKSVRDNRALLGMKYVTDTDIKYETVNQFRITRNPGRLQQIQEYRKNGLNYNEIGLLLNVSRQAVYMFLKKYS